MPKRLYAVPNTLGTNSNKRPRTDHTNNTDHEDDDDCSDELSVLFGKQPKESNTNDAAMANKGGEEVETLKDDDADEDADDSNGNSNGSSSTVPTTTENINEESNDDDKSDEGATDPRTQEVVVVDHLEPTTTQEPTPEDVDIIASGNAFLTAINGHLYQHRIHVDTVARDMSDTKSSMLKKLQHCMNMMVNIDRSQQQQLQEIAALKAKNAELEQILSEKTQSKTPKKSWSRAIKSLQARVLMLEQQPEDSDEEE